MVEYSDVFMSFAIVLDLLGSTLAGIFGLRVIERILREIKRRQPAYVPVPAKGIRAPSLRRSRRR